MNVSAAVVDAIVDRLGPAATPNAPLAPLCTYKVGGTAAVLVDVDHIDTLVALAEVLGHDPATPPVLVVGRGSNLLVADAGFDGVVLRLGAAFETIEIDTEAATFVVGGAVLLPVAARKSAAAGLAGFEWAVGVPGSIGGAVRMNAGGHGADMAASLVEVTTFDVADVGLRQRPAADLDLAYRHSSIGSSEIVLSATLQLAPGDREASEATISEIVRWRRANQPGGQNAGSVFANPDGDSAGRLIDAAGLKGHRIGTAEVSTKHANFIQADPNGSADDVVAVIRHVQSVVSDTFGVVLRPENVLVGFDEETK